MDNGSQHYVDVFTNVTRNCSAGEGLWPKTRCIKTGKFTSCMCDTDNCNKMCIREDCKKIAISRRPGITTFDCSANCKAEGIKTVLLLIDAVVERKIIRHQHNLNII